MHNSSTTSLVVDANTPSPFLISFPRQVQRKIAARWQEWVPWVLLYLRHRGYDAAGMSAESARLRRRHSDHLIALMQLGIGMRLVRRHRLDDPRITEEARAALVQCAIKRRRKAWLARHRSMNTSERTGMSELDNLT